MSGLWIASSKPRQQGSVMDGLAVAVLLFATVSLFASPSGAQELAPGSGKVDARGSVYRDDDETTIITSYVGTELGLPGRVRFGAHGLVDIISTASVDVVAAATPSFEEVRVEFGARAGMVVSDGVDLGLAFVRSAENDWTSYIPQLTSSSANPTTTTRARLPTQTIRSAPLLLLKPLDTRSGGYIHDGASIYGEGDVFVSTDDPGYKILEAWIGGTATAKPNCEPITGVGP